MATARSLRAHAPHGTAFRTLFRALPRPPRYDFLNCSVTSLLAAIQAKRKEKKKGRTWLRQTSFAHSRARRGSTCRHTIDTLPFVAVQPRVCGPLL